MFEALFFVFVFVFVLILKCKGSVASPQFSFSDLFKSSSLRSWMLEMLLSVIVLINFLLFSLLRKGTLRDHS